METIDNILAKALEAKTDEDLVTLQDELNSLQIATSNEFADAAGTLLTAQTDLVKVQREADLQEAKEQREKLEAEAAKNREEAAKILPEEKVVEEEPKKDEKENNGDANPEPMVRARKVASRKKKKKKAEGSELA